MRKTKKAVASLAIAGMVLSMAPMSVFGATTDSNRLAGAGRVETAIAVANQGWANGADSVIVVPADDANIVDALAAAPLAGQLKAPILVTYRDALDANVAKEIKNLGAKNVYAVGALSADTVASLKAISGVTVTALQGADRTETAAKVAAQLTNVKGSFVVAYNGTADALSAASFAAANGYSIVVSNPDGTIPASEKVTAPVYTVGGQAKYDGATKLAGADRYATNDAVNNGLTFKYDKVYVANGESLVDALAGAPLAAQTNSPIVLADATKAATGVNDNLTDSSKVIALGGVGAVSDAVLGQVNKGNVNTGVVSVSSVKAASANSIKVAFTAAPADTSKVTFKVTRGTTNAPITTTWNANKTEAVLASSSNFAEGVYSVVVKNGDTDLGTTSVDFTAQRVAKIEFDSNKLAVVTGGKTGYVSYRALDQYGNDITDKYLASDSYINWTCGIGNVKSDNKGILTITPFGFNPDPNQDKSTTVLTQYQTTVITAVTKSQNIPCSATATLNISTQIGTISDIALNKLVTADGDAAAPQVGDSEKYYIDYTAKDMAGNETKSLTLMENGLITIDNKDKEYKLVTSNSQLVTAKLVEDPKDDTKCAIEVSILDPDNYTMIVDQPITITATSYTGKTDSLTFSLKRAQKVNTFTLMAPTQTISSGETGVEIPFVAYDQDGKQLTKYTDITKDKVVALSPEKKDGATTGLYFEENADSTASLKYDAPVLPVGATTAQQETLNATVNNTGNFSSVTINVDVAKKGDTLKLDESVLISRMQLGSTQALDFGYNDGGFKVEDQYGRAIDMTSKNVIDGVTYYVKASVPTNDYLEVDSTQNYAFAGHEVVLKAKNKAGSATVKFELMKSTDATIGNDDDLSLDTKTLSMTVLADDKITDYVISEAPNPIYATSDATPTPQQKDQFVKLILNGKTSSGSKVVLDPSKVTIGTSSNSDFYTFMGDDNTQTKVAANKLDASKTGSSATISATAYNSNDMRYHTATTTVTSKTDEAVAQTMGFYAQTVDRADSVTATGITYDGTTVTVNLNGTQGKYTAQGANAASLGIPANNVLNAIAGRDLTRYTNKTAAAVPNQHDALTAGEDNRGYIYLYAKDQYGTKDMNLSQVKLADCSVNASKTPVAQVVDNTLVFNYIPTASDYVVVSGIATNGQMQTIKIKFEGTVPASTFTTDVANDKTALTVNYDGTASTITLPTTGASGSTITWTEKTDASNVSSLTGSTATITRSNADDTDDQVTYTATIAKGGVSDTKDVTVTVKEAKAPTVTSANFTDATHLTLVFSEAVNATAANFANGATSAPGTFTVDSVAGSGTNTITLTVTGTPAIATGVTGTVDVSNVTDLAGNAITAVTGQVISSGF